MTRLTETEKVSRIFRALERELDGDLFLRNTGTKLGRVKVVRKGFGSELGRPDVIVWVELELHVLGIRTELRVPILVEAEDAGLRAAKEDFIKFFEREKLAIPMVVIGKRGAPKLPHTEEAQANVCVEMLQIGFDRVPVDNP
jgi:hypothetical protein